MRGLLFSFRMRFLILFICFLKSISCQPPPTSNDNNNNQHNREIDPFEVLVGVSAALLLLPFLMVVVAAVRYLEIRCEASYFWVASFYYWMLLWISVFAYVFVDFDIIKVEDRREDARTLLIITSVVLYVFMLGESVLYYIKKIMYKKARAEHLDLTKLQNARPEIIWDVQNDDGPWESKKFEYGHWRDCSASAVKGIDCYAVTKIKFKLNVSPGDDETQDALKTQREIYQNAYRNCTETFTIDGYVDKMRVHSEKFWTWWMFGLFSVIGLTWPYRLMLKCCKNKVKFIIDKVIYMSAPENTQDQVNHYVRESPNRPQAENMPEVFATAQNRPQPYTRTENSPQPYTRTEISPQPYTRTENSPQPYTRTEISPQPYIKTENILQPYNRYENSPQASTRVEFSPQPYTRYEISPQPYTRTENSPQPYTRTENSPQPYTRTEISPQPYIKTENILQPYNRYEISPQPYTRYEDSPQPYTRYEDSPQPYTRYENSPQAYTRVENMPQPYTRAEIINQPYTRNEKIPQRYFRHESSPQPYTRTENRHQAYTRANDRLQMYTRAQDRPQVYTRAENRRQVYTIAQNIPQVYTIH